jgi:hypothetical protein
MVKDACEEQLEKMAPAEAKAEQLNFDTLFWELKQGVKGPFEQTSDKSNGNSDLWKQLKVKLHEHNGFYQHRGVKYWFDRGNDTIIDRRKA